MADQSAIDRATFDQLLASVGDDMAFMGDLIDTYLADGAEMLAQMRRSLTAGDLEGFRRAAHSLKSNSANFGAAGLAAEARELEMMARAGTLDGAAAGLARAEDGFGQVKVELGRLRAAA